jgi:hypothetical protein
MQHISLPTFEKLFGLNFHNAFLLCVNVFKHDNLLQALRVFTVCRYLAQLDKPFENIRMFLWQAVHSTY